MMVLKRLRTIGMVLFATVAVASIITLPQKSNRSPGALLTGARVPAPVRALIERSCRDCHSESTDYPWYSYIFPVSKMIRDDVVQGRERLNFSRWDAYTVIRRERALSEIANQVQDGGMPLSLYLVIHPAARLSRADVEAIFNWTQDERMRLITSSR
jgi:Haem-binding domain